MSCIVHSFLAQAPSAYYSTTTQRHLVHDCDGAKEKEMNESEGGVWGQSTSGNVGRCKTQL